MDVAIIGAGIVGVVTATLLKEAGMSVALLDARRVLQGCTGYTTAKLTSSHGVIYSHLTKSFGAEGARTYGEANEAAIEWVDERVQARGDDCGFERQPNFVYTEDPDEVETLQEEALCARDAGLPASFTTETQLPWPVRGAVRFENQAQFHPRAFLWPLVEALPGDGSHVFAHTAATAFSENDRCLVETQSGSVTCTDVVIATHMPVFDRGLFFAKAHPYASYCVAGPLPEERAFEGMYISTGSGETRSIRTIPGPEGRLLLVGGNGHKLGRHDGTGDNYRSLQDFGHRWWAVADFPDRWSAHDYVSVDKVPFVGRFTRSSDHVYVATGFGKWGMTNGIAAAMMISDQIQGRPNRWAPFFDAKRINLAQVKESITENAQVAQRFVVDRLPGGSNEDLAPGEGRVVSEGAHKVALYRAPSGEVHRLSARCTHLGCIVKWNDGDRTWDCPCHGSRFTAEGQVVNGPAIDDLKPLDH